MHQGARKLLLSVPHSLLGGPLVPFCGSFRRFPKWCSFVSMRWAYRVHASDPGPRYWRLRVATYNLSATSPPSSTIAPPNANGD